MHFRSVASDALLPHSLSAPGITSVDDGSRGPAAFDPHASLYARARRSLHREQRMNTPNTTPQTNAAPKTGNAAQSTLSGSTQSKNLLDTAAANGAFGTFSKAVA
jgi:hypothetical protein